MPNNPRLAVVSSGQILEGYFAGNWSKQPVLQPVPNFQGSAAGLSREVRAPALWIYENGLLIEIDLLTQLATGRTVAIEEAPLSIQVDPFTGDLWMAWSNKIMTIARSATTATEFKVYDSNIGIGFGNLADLKLDQFRRCLWVSDSSAGKIYRIRLSDGAVTTRVQPDTYIRPSAIGLDLGSGFVYVRCFNPNDMSERLFEVQDEIENSWSSPEARTLPNLPLSGSIITDSDRQQVWWVTENYIGMVNLKTNSGRVRHLATGTGIAIDVDLTNGDAYVLVEESPGSSLRHIDCLNANQINSRLLPDASEPNSLFIEQGYHQLLAAHFNITSNTTETGALTASFGIRAQGGTVSLLATASQSDDNPDTAEYLPSATDSIGPTQNVLVWADESNGLKGVITGGLKPMLNQTLETPNVVRLPKFSWTSTSWVKQPAIAVGRLNGDIELWQVEVESDGSFAGISAGPVLLGENLPFGRQKITGIAAAKGATMLYASTKTHLVECDADTLGILGTQKLSSEAIVWDFGNWAWLEVVKLGVVSHIELAESSSQSHSSYSSSTFVSETSSSSSNTMTPYSSSSSSSTKSSDNSSTMRSSSSTGLSFTSGSSSSSGDSVTSSTAISFSSSTQLKTSSSTAVKESSSSWESQSSSFSISSSSSTRISQSSSQSSSNSRSSSSSVL